MNSRFTAFYDSSSYSTVNIRIEYISRQFIAVLFIVWLTRNMPDMDTAHYKVIKILTKSWHKSILIVLKSPANFSFGSMSS